MLERTIKLTLGILEHGLNVPIFVEVDYALTDGSLTNFISSCASTEAVTATKII